MAPEQAEPRRMDIHLGVRISVVMSMMRNPPKRPVLTGQDTQQRQHELEPSARAVGAMCQKAVIASGDPEDLEDAGDCKNRYGSRSRTDDEHQGARPMQDEERHDEGDMRHRIQWRCNGFR